MLFYVYIVAKSIEMVIKKDAVRYVANLARIGLAPDEEELFARQLNDILVYMEKLNKLNTRDAEPMSHAVFLGNVFRDDKVKKSLPKDEVLKNAPGKEKDFFKVPKIIE